MKSSNTSERLKAIMEIRRLRQIDILNQAKPFCDKYGVKLGKNDLSQYVSGKVEPGQEKLTVLGLALDVSETWLMGYDVPMERENNLYTPERVDGARTIEDEPEIRAIQRAAKNMSSVDKQRMLSMLQIAFEEAFKDADGQ